jgi:small membrane protein
MNAFPIIFVPLSLLAAEALGRDAEAAGPAADHWNGFQLIFVPFCLAMAVRELLRWRARAISPRHGLLWTLAWSAGAVIIYDPQIATRAARYLGIGRGSDLVFYLAILAGMTMSLYFYSRYRRLEIMLTELVRRDALARPERGAAPGMAAVQEEEPR